MQHKEEVSDSEQIKEPKPSETTDLEQKETEVVSNNLRRRNVRKCDKSHSNICTNSLDIGLPDKPCIDNFNPLSHVPYELPTEDLNPKFFDNFFNDVLPYELPSDANCIRRKAKSRSPDRFRRNVILETVDAWSNLEDRSESGNLGLGDALLLKPLVFGGTFPIDAPTDVTKRNNNNSSSNSFSNDSSDESDLEPEISDRKFKEILDQFKADDKDDKVDKDCVEYPRTFDIDAPF